MNSNKQNIFYYSNFCQHSQKTLQFLVRANIVNEIACVCVDKRGRDPHTNQLYVVLDNGNKVIMPPHVHSVPAMLISSDNYRVVYGDDVAKMYESRVINNQMVATNFNGEPSGFSLSGLGSSLTSSGSAGLPLSMSYSGQTTINTPPTDYGSNKIKEGDTSISNLEEIRQSQDAQLGIGGKNPFLQPISNSRPQ
jgi:hypothetical protein